MREGSWSRTKRALRRPYFAVFPGGAIPNDPLHFSIDLPLGQAPLRIVRGRCFVRGWILRPADGAVPKTRVLVNASPHHTRITSRPDVHGLYGGAGEFSGFELAINLGRGLCRLQIQAESETGWRPLYTTVILSLGQRVKVRTIDHEARLVQEARWAPLEAKQFRQHVALMIKRPVFEVVVRRTGEGDLEATKASLAGQIYPNGRLVVVDNFADSTVAPLDAPPADYRLFLDAGDRLAEAALYAFADVLQSQDADILYGDEDLMDGRGARRAPFFKPDWSPAYLEGCNYLGHAACFRADARFALGEGRHDFARRVALTAVQVSAVRRVLLHRPLSAAQALLADAGRRPAARAEIPQVVTPPRRVFLALSHLNGRAPSSALSWSDSQAFKVTPIDLSRARGTWWRDAGGRPEDIVVLLDADLTPEKPGWLSGLVTALDMPGVGAAGPVLVSADGRSAQYGLTNGGGLPEAIQPRPDDLDRTPATPREVFGVSETCLATRIECLEKAGDRCGALGPDLSGLDLCLRIAGLGLRTVHTPLAVLRRGGPYVPPSSAAISLYQMAWPRESTRDPYYREDMLRTEPATFETAIRVLEL